MLRNLSFALLLLTILAISTSCENYDDELYEDDFGDELLEDRASSTVGTYQAEDRTFQSGCKQMSNKAGYTGRGFMDYGGNGSLVEWNNVTAPSAGQYRLILRYANGSAGNRQCAITVNGATKGNVAFGKTGSWTTWRTASIKVTLRKGNNKIRVTASTGSGGPNLDKMDVISDGDPVVVTGRCALVNEHSTATLSCPSGQVIKSIGFASYGLPTGSCSAGFSTGTCHASSSKSKVQSLCLNRQSCKVDAKNTVFGDPCRGERKKLAVVYTCGGGDVVDSCPNDPNKTKPGKCGCGTPDTDSDKDGTPNCNDNCPSDPGKTEPGECGCGKPEGTCNPNPGWCTPPSSNSNGWQSERVYCNDKGRLEYRVDGQGNRMPDFSYVGYRYGAAISQVPTVSTISPVSGDNTKRIQNAIDAVARRNVSGKFRGALLLRRGTYRVDNPVKISSSGVVLRGEGSNTIIQSTRTGRDDAVIKIGRFDSESEWNTFESGSRTSITDSTVPIRNRSFNVANSEHFSRGDLVVVRQLVNDRWFTAVDDGGTVNDPGWRERDFSWMDISFTREVESVSGRRITLDAPLYYRLNSQHGDLVLYKYNESSSRGRTINHVGVEKLRIDIVSTNDSDPDHAESGILVRGVIDGWIRDVEIDGFSEDGIHIGRSLRFTADRVTVGPPAGPREGGKFYGFTGGSGAQQILMRRCTSRGLRHGFTQNGSTRSSGFVVLDGRLIDNSGASEGGHRQWAMGALFDNLVVSGTSSLAPLTFANRGDFGTSHGWATANSVAWNSDVSASSGDLIVMSPPTAQNYAIGTRGSVRGYWRYFQHFEGEPGYEEGTNAPGNLFPSSLYQAQLKDRTH